MKKYLFAALALSFIATPGFALGDKSNDAAYKLLENLKRSKQVRRLEQAPIVKFMPSPGASVEQGNEYSVFISPMNSYTDSNTLLDATLDGTPVGLIHSSESLWIYHSAGFSEQRSHTLVVSLAVEKKDLANQIRTSVDRLSKEIFKLQQKIDAETDPVKKGTFISQRDEKIAIKNELIRQLAELKTPVATQSFSFEVVPASNPNFPRLTGISPQAGSATGGVPVTISGENFVTGMTVKIGGLATSANFVNPTTITATTPNFGGNTGIKDVEVRFPPLPGSTEIRNSFLKNAYFATNSSLEANVPPVAVAGPHHSYLLGADMLIDGSGSYDPNQGTTLSYEWKVVDAPAGSGLTAGQVVSTDVQPHLSLAVVGYYIFELKVTEVNTDLRLVSEASLTTVEVHGPVNHAPVPTANAITAYSNGTASTTVAPNDPDSNQSWTFTVVVPPAHGNAPVNAQGVMFYTSFAGYTGADSVTVRVTDNGSPAQFGDVVIPVTVGPANAPPAPLPLTITVSNGISATGQINPNDPNPGQTFTYQLVGQPAHGFASVGQTTGLVTYNANQNYNGADSLRVRVFDNGAPVKFNDLVVNIVIPNRPPVLRDSYYEVHSKGLPVSTSIFSFDGDMDGTVVERSVDYGDGSPVDKRSNAPNYFFFDHDYPALGTYNVTLTNKDNQGAVSVDHVTVNITNQSVPFPKFKMSTDRGTAPLTVTFDASSSVAGDTPITKYSFAFGEGGPGDIDSSNPVQSHTYTNPGVYTVFVYVGDANNGRNYALARVYVDAAPTSMGAEPYGRMEVGGPREITVGTTVSFSAANSNNPNVGGSFTDFDWTYGDYHACPACTGHTTVPTTSFQYNNVGTYFTGVKVTTDQGDFSFGGSTISVVNSGHAPRPVVANWGPTDTLSGVGHYTFDANGIGSFDFDGTIQSYFWSFADFTACPSDGCTANGPFASHTYVTPGFYLAGLRVTDNDNNESTAYVGISVTPSYRVTTRLDSPKDSPQRAEQRRNLIGACATKSAASCYFLGKMYAEDGNAYTAGQLYQKSCGLGYEAGCLK